MGEMEGVMVLESEIVSKSEGDTDSSEIDGEVDADNDSAIVSEAEKEGVPWDTVSVTEVDSEVEREVVFVSERVCVRVTQSSREAEAR